MPKEQNLQYRFYKIGFKPARGTQLFNTYEFKYDIITGRQEDGIEIKQELTLICHEEAVGNFHRVMQDLKQYMIQLCELPVDFKNKSEVRALHCDYHEHENGSKVMGAVISGLYKFKYSNGVQAINTPHKQESHYKEAGGTDDILIDEDACKLMYQLFDEAKKYVTGLRAQQKLL